MSGFLKGTVTLIVARDNGACARCGRQVTHLMRGDAWAIHHRCPRGSGGTSVGWVNSAANGLVLCAECHREVEANRARAERDGFLLSRLGRATALVIPVRHAVHGWVLLDEHGGFERVLEALAVELLVAFGMRPFEEVGA